MDLEKLGNSLREIRLGKGISLEQVEAATKIRSYYIESLENGNLEAMPGQIYTIGFVRSYAKFLGLQEEEIVNAYKEYYARQTDDVEAKKMEQVILEQNRGQIRNVKDKRESKGNQPKKSSAKPGPALRNNATPPRPIRTRERSFGSKFIWVALLLVIIFAVLILYFIGKRAENAPPDIPPTDNGQVEEPNNGGSQPPVLPDETDPGQLPDGGEDPNVPPAVDTEEPEAPISGVEVKVTTTASCWVSVTIDGKSQQETIPANETRTYTGEEKIVIKYGNAGYVTVEHNGKPAEPFPAGTSVTTQEYGKVEDSGADSTQTPE